MAGTWDDVNRRLTSAYLALDLGDGHVIGDERPVVRSGFRGRKVTTLQAPRRYVHVVAAQSMLLAELVGSTSFGGEWEMSPETEESLVRLGWERPWSPEVHVFQREAHLSHANRLALGAVRALRLLGCDPAALEVEFVRDPDAD